jgi:pentatricopeptide repeat protein
LLIFLNVQIADYIVETKLFPWTAMDQVVRISLKGKLGSSSEVERIFNTSPPELQTEIAYNAVIKHFCDRGMLKKATEWIDKLMKAGLMTHAFAFNRLLVLYKGKGQADKVNEVLATMEKAGIAKDIYTYNIWMSIKGKQKDVAAVEEIFAQCKADPNVREDPSTYATVAGTYVDLGLTEKAATALEEGAKIGFEKSGNADQVIATLWGKMGKKEKVLDLWNVMKKKHTVPARHYVIMIETFGRLGMVEQAEMLFEEMHETKGTVRPRQFTALLGTYAKNNMTEKVDSFVGRLEALGLKRSPTVYHHMVNAYLKMGQVDKALALLDDAKWKNSVPMWFTTMILLLDAVAERGDVTQAEKIFDNIRTTYSQKNQNMYNLLLKSYARAGLPADGFLLRMAGDRIFPNKETQDLLQLCAAKVAEASTGVPYSESSPATLA